MAGYFELFPTTEYGGSLCTDLTRRVVVRTSITSDPRAYAPYEVPAGERADQVAYGYYGLSEREWIVHYSAGIMDPYFDWYLSDNNFESHVVEKYGSLEEALERVHHWEVNWYGSDVEITPGQWQQLVPQLRSYYEPTFGKGSEILTYVRREDDVRTSTNMVVTVTVDQANVLSAGDRLQVLSGPALEGSAEVTWAVGDRAKLVHVQTGADPGLTLKVASTGETVTIVSREFTANVIPIEERPFWTPVSMLAHERDKNESRKNVRLIDSRYSRVMEDEMTRLLRMET